MAYLVSMKRGAVWTDVALLLGATKELQWLLNRPDDVHASILADLRLLLGGQRRPSAPLVVDSTLQIHFESMRRHDELVHPDGRRTYQLAYRVEDVPVHLNVLTPAGTI